MTPRQTKQGAATAPAASSLPPTSQGNPIFPQATQEHNFHTQAVFNINGQVAKLETGLQHMETRLSNIESKLDEVRLEVVGAKRVITVVGVVISGLGGVALLFLNKILDAAAKHIK